MLEERLRRSFPEVERVEAPTLDKASSWEVVVHQQSWRIPLVAMVIHR